MKIFTNDSRSIILRANPATLTEDELISWLQANHGDRFDEIEFWDGGGIQIDKMRASEDWSIFVWGDNGLITLETDDFLENITIP
tara:strand:+ start:1361 stop:1615 length:255 start_codon:yes stop_codon:yes gene_type:complete